MTCIDGHDGGDCNPAVLNPLRFRQLLSVMFILPALLIGGHAAGAEDDSRFVSWLQCSREAFAKNHLIAYVKVEPGDTAGPAIECRYDRYPNQERIQEEDGATYARKKSGKWLKSDDWGETGKPVKPAKATELDKWRGLVDVPLLDMRAARDKSQGEIVVRLVDEQKTTEGDQTNQPA